MLDSSQIKALVSLLDDSETEVWETAYNALLKTPYEETETLQNCLYEVGESSVSKNRLELCIQEITIQHFGNALMDWKRKGGVNLLEALVYVCRFRYPEVTEQQLTEYLETMRLDAWLEFHYDLTSFEKVKILNYILFQLHGFKGDEDDFLHFDNGYINKVLENRKGNPISLSIVYILVAQRLNVPIYGINLPRHFIMAYVEDDETDTIDHFNDKQVISHIAKGEIKFYINAYNGGGVFNQQHLRSIMQEMELEEKPEYMLPCTNADIILRVLMNLYNSYQHAERAEAVMIDQVISKYREQV